MPSFTNLDYLNIDVEGNEENVLDGFAIKKYSPELVSIEIHSEKCPPTNNKIYKFFTSNGYKLSSIYGWTYFFEKSNNRKIHFYLFCNIQIFLKINIEIFVVLYLNSATLATT